MLAHREKTERLCCCQGPVAYAHRQRSVALRAEIGRSQAVWGVRHLSPAKAHAAHKESEAYHS